MFYSVASVPALKSFVVWDYKPFQPGIYRVYEWYTVAFGGLFRYVPNNTKVRSFLDEYLNNAASESGKERNDVLIGYNSVEELLLHLNDGISWDRDYSFFTDPDNLFNLTLLMNSEVLPRKYKVPSSPSSRSSS